LVAGVDLGGTKIQTVVTRSQQVAGSARSMTPRGGAEQVIEAILAGIRESVAAAGVESKLAAVGIGTPGEVDEASGSVSRAVNVPGFETRVELGPLVSEALGGVPVTVDNDVRSALWGEFLRGAGRPYRNLLGVYVGTGVGGGVILDGRLRRGRGAAGEIGHAVVKVGGRRCNCGRRGCLEAYASRSRMEVRARRLEADGDRTILFDLMRRRNRDRLTSSVIFEALERRDAVATDLIADAVWALGAALASVQNVLDLEAIIIGGGLGDRLGKPFVERVSKAMGPHLFIPDNPPVMLTSELGDLSGAMGAAILAGG
jgi:glucokinase